MNARNRFAPVALALIALAAGSALMALAQGPAKVAGKVKTPVVESMWLVMKTPAQPLRLLMEPDPNGIWKVTASEAGLAKALRRTWEAHATCNDRVTKFEVTHPNLNSTKTEVQSTNPPKSSLNGVFTVQTLRNKTVIDACEKEAAQKPDILGLGGQLQIWVTGEALDDRFRLAGQCSNLQGVPTSTFDPEYKPVIEVLCCADCTPL
jgi:hypothetical protein